VLLAGQELQLGDLTWQIHAAPGHDPDSVILFEPQSRCLISADALWQHGFGVVFPELVDTPAFELVGQTLDLIEKLNPVVVIPGHGQVFSDVADSLIRARERLAVFQKYPIKHTSHAAKVLLKFKLMELKKIAIAEFVDWAIQTQLIQTIIKQSTEEKKPTELVNEFLAQLSKANVIKVEDSFIYDVA
jgi:glyoxylase-like metal-dependent hydrolase (beta-lactamase superfamily II)